MSKPIIQIRQLTAAYAQKTVLRDISLTIYDDDYLGIIGSNGGGKTTLMKLILGMMKPQSGTITYYKESASNKFAWATYRNTPISTSTFPLL